MIEWSLITEGAYRSEANIVASLFIAEEMNDPYETKDLRDLGV